MKETIKNLFAAAIIAAFPLASFAADSIEQSEFPQVTAQPVDEDVFEGESTALFVQATNANGFQWLRNGQPLQDQTNNSLVLENVGTNDVGLYSCEVYRDEEVVPTRAASLNVVTTTGTTITVYGTPIQVSGTVPNCPGAYAGYVSYRKTIAQGWGWAPTATAPHIASDGSGRTDTKIEYVGRLGDRGCDQTAVTIPHPPYSNKYRFAIYFASDVPTGPYPLQLEGFNP